MSQRYSHEQALHTMLNFVDTDDSGSGFFMDMREFASNFPDQPFTGEHLQKLASSVDSPDSFVFYAILFSMAGHCELLPLLGSYFAKSNKIRIKLQLAAAMAQLGDESGYQFIEDVFQRYMKQDKDMKNFDFEDFVFIFEEIIVNERGQEMIARFRKEANYSVVWETLETPDL